MKILTISFIARSASGHINLDMRKKLGISGKVVQLDIPWNGTMVYFQDG